MKRSIAMKWIKALESGRYKQGQRCLRSKDDDGNIKYCCLGVLCNITKTTKWKHEGRNGTLYGEAGILPAEIAKKAGMETGPSPTVLHGGLERKTFVTLNDLVGLNFKQIAKVIREHWRVL
jgi:hypothetical protein